jgi:hypothetical protein
MIDEWRPHEDTILDVCWLKVVIQLAIKYSHFSIMISLVTSLIDFY